ncbi:WLM domain-containing protein [Astrocystis sublimbata]|nr:WLM domain-containing protein [Astrocystis sublimbata]
MLHELAHIVHGPHDAKFNALWNQLRDEHMSLTLKGFTGEGFMSEGHRLGGRTLPMDEARRLARASAERRRTLGAGSGRRLGGAAPRPGQDIRKVIADSVEQRNRTLRGCANDNQTQDQIIEIADTATRNGFRTKAEEDAANEAAIAQALWELVQEEEKAKKGSAYRPPTADIGTNQDYVGFYGSGQGPNANVQPSTSRPAAQRQEATGTWACSVCTLSNPLNYLCCDACGTERGERTAPKRQAVIDLTGPDDRHVKKSTSTSSSSSASKGKEPRKAPPRPQPKISSTSSTWACHFCGRVRESQWWSCDLCGAIKTSS